MAGRSTYYTGDLGHLRVRENPEQILRKTLFSLTKTGLRKWVKCLPLECEVLCLEPQNLCKARCVCILPPTERWQTTNSQTYGGSLT